MNKNEQCGSGETPKAPESFCQKKKKEYFPTGEAREEISGN